MKKIILLVSFLGIFLPAWSQAQTDESRMFIHPFKEVFVNYPSQTLGSGVRLTVFLPEEKIPLSNSYPLVVFLGLSRQEVEQAQALAVKNKVLLAAVSWEEWADSSKTAGDVANFIHRELIPYLETNYPVIRGGNSRTLAAKGARDSQAVLNQLIHADWVGRIALLEPGTVVFPADRVLEGVRFYVVGNQQELASVQKLFEDAGLAYGADFALRYAKDNQNPLYLLDFTYLNGSAQDLEIEKLDAFTQQDILPVEGGANTKLRVAARLKNKYWFDYIALQVRFSPPYLTWNPQQGTIQVVPGAQPGTVKIQSGVDKPRFVTKIKLKNQ